MDHFFPREYPDDQSVRLLSFDEQCKIIEAARGKRRGRNLVGSEICKLPLPRGSAGSIIAGLDLQDELEKTKEALDKALEEQARERAKADEFRRQMEVQFKALADHVKFNFPRTSHSSSSGSDPDSDPDSDSE